MYKVHCRCRRASTEIALLRLLISYHIISYHIIRQAESDKTLSHYSGHTLFTLFFFPSLSLSLSFPLTLSPLLFLFLFLLYAHHPSPCHSNSLPLHLPLLASHPQLSLLQYHYRTIKCKQFNITITENFNETLNLLFVTLYRLGLGVGRVRGSSGLGVKVRVLDLSSVSRILSVPKIGSHNNNS